MRINVGLKLAAGFVIIFGLTVMNWLVSNHLLNKAKNIDKVFTEIIIPSEEYLKELKMKLSSSEQLSRNWFFQPKEEEKSVLRDMHESQFPIIFSKLDTLKQRWTIGDTSRINSALRGAQELLTAQEVLMETLDTDDDYGNPENIDLALMIIDQLVTPNTPKLVQRLEKVESDVLHMSDQIAASKEEAYDQLSLSNLVLSALLLIIGGFSTFFIGRLITRPLKDIQVALEKLSKGILPKYRVQVSKDELGDISKAVYRMIASMKLSVQFAKEIGHGNLNANHKLLSKQDELGLALNAMRNELLTAQQQEVARKAEQLRLNRANELMALFGNVFTSNNDIETISGRFLSETRKHFKALAGSIMLVEEDFLKPLVCSAKANSSKTTNNHVMKGEGLAGECWKQGKPIYLEGIKANYLTIESGLGNQGALSLFLCPIMDHNKVLGVVELGGLKSWTEDDRELLFRLCQSFGDAINTRTHSGSKSANDYQKLVEENERLRLELDRLQQ